MMPSYGNSSGSVGSPELSSGLMLSPERVGT